MSTPLGTESLLITGKRVTGAYLRLQDSKRAIAVCDTGPGAVSPSTYTHPQAVAQPVWTVNHNMGFRPSVRAYSAGGREMWAEIVHDGVSRTYIYFDTATAGYAVCS